MNTFSKAERLYHTTLFEELFASGNSFTKYPFRIVFKISSIKSEFPARFAIAVSKKKFKKAVQRNKIKRLTREVYRLNKNKFYSLQNKDYTIDIIFIYLANEILPYSTFEKAMKISLEKIIKHLKEEINVTKQPT